MISYAPFWKTIKMKKVSAYALSIKLGVNPSTLSRMRHNKYLSLRTVEDFCKILDCKVEDIVEYIPNTENEK